MTTVSALQTQMSACAIAELPLDRPIALSELKKQSQTVVDRCDELAARIQRQYAASMKDLLGDLDQSKLTLHYESISLKVCRFVPTATAPFHMAKIPLNGTSFVFREDRSYMLFGCPPCPQMAGDFLDGMLQQKISIFVSVLQSRERSDEIFNEFWTAENLTKITSIDGWRFAVKERRTLAIIPPSPHIFEAAGTALHETIITATQGAQTRTLTHLHLDGWQDGMNTPDQPLFLQLMTRVEELQEERRVQKQSDCVAINCVGGIGRSGTTALQLQLRHQIRRATTTSSDITKATIDIAQEVLFFRIERAHFMQVSPLQIAENYQLASYYVKQHQRQCNLISRLAQCTALSAHTITAYAGIIPTYFKRRPTTDAQFSDCALTKEKLQTHTPTSEALDTLAYDVEFHALFSTSLQGSYEYQMIVKHKDTFQISSTPQALDQAALEFLSNVLKKDAQIFAESGVEVVVNIPLYTCCFLQLFDVCIDISFVLSSLYKNITLFLSKTA